MSTDSDTTTWICGYEVERQNQSVIIFSSPEQDAIGLEYALGESPEVDAFMGIKDEAGYRIVMATTHGSIGTITAPADVSSVDLVTFHFFAKPTIEFSHDEVRTVSIHTDWHAHDEWVFPVVRVEMGDDHRLVYNVTEVNSGQDQRYFSEPTFSIHGSDFEIDVHRNNVWDGSVNISPPIGPGCVRSILD